MEKLRKLIAEHSGLLTVILFFIGICLSYYIISFELKEEEKKFINIISLTGTIFSFFGLAITFIQIIAIKEISVITQTTIKETKNKLILGISISDVTEAIKLISEIDNFLGTQKYEVARLKIIDLREKLIQFKSSEEFLLIVENDSIKQIIEKLNIQISTLYSIIYSEEDIKYNPENITDQLQDISTYLSDFRNNIKYQTV